MIFKASKDEDGQRNSAEYSQSRKLDNDRYKKTLVKPRDIVNSMLVQVQRPLPKWSRYFFEGTQMNSSECSLQVMCRKRKSAEYSLILDVDHVGKVDSEHNNKDGQRDAFRVKRTKSSSKSYMALNTACELCQKVNLE